MKTVVESLSAEGGEWQQATAAALCELSWMHNSIHQYEEGLEAAARCTEIYDKHGVTLADSIERQAALAQEVHAAVHLRRDGEVIKACRQGRAMLLKMMPTAVESTPAALEQSPTGPSMCTLVGEMAEAYRYLRNLGEAARMADTSLTLCRNVYGENHRNTAVALVRKLTMTLCKIEFDADIQDWSDEDKETQYQTQLEELIPLSLAAAEIFKQAYGLAHPATLTHMARHARCVSLQGQPLEAAPLFVKACSLMAGSKELQQRSAHAHALANQAYNYLSLGQCAEAELIFAEALHIMRLRPESFPGQTADHYTTSFERKLKQAKRIPAVQGRYALAGPAKYAP